MPVVDTSWLIRLLNRNDPKHAQARQAARGRTRLIVPSLVLAEVLQVTEFETRKKEGSKAGREAARFVYKSLRQNPSFSIEPEYDLDMADTLYVDHASLSYVDAAGIATAFLHATDLLTFDGRQAKLFAGLPS